MFFLFVCVRVRVYECANMSHALICLIAAYGHCALQVHRQNQIWLGAGNTQVSAGLTHDACAPVRACVRMLFTLIWGGSAFCVLRESQA